MVSREDLYRQLEFTLSGFEPEEGVGTFYSGKVRDCITIKSSLSGARRILIATDRLSAFDRILTTIPFKGAMLNGVANFWFEETKILVPNHVIATPHPYVTVCEELQIIPIEMVVRGYLTGSAWRDYTAGKDVSGVRIKPGKKKNEAFSVPLITPSTKAAQGQHDLPISGQELIAQGVVDKLLWDKLCDAALKLFEYGTKRAAERGLILVDTKYEFGLRPGTRELVLADEIHTQDSSRYWLSSTYEERFSAGEEPEMLSKEFVRTWLMEQNFYGDGEAPVISDDFRVQTAERYMEAFELITGESFTLPVGRVTEEIAGVIKDYV
jgi:phosphoribosylaminoimidazole-succinocarboxamide synthase